MRLNLEDISEDEIQRAMAVRRPGRYGEPYIIDEVRVVGKCTDSYGRVHERGVKVFTYESLSHQQQGRGFRPPGEIIPLDELPQIKRYIALNKLGI
jgi:hypothetical protein